VYLAVIGMIRSLGAVSPYPYSTVQVLLPVSIMSASRARAVFFAAARIEIVYFVSLPEAGVAGSSIDVTDAPVSAVPVKLTPLGFFKVTEIVSPLIALFTSSEATVPTVGTTGVPHFTVDGLSAACAPGAINTTAARAIVIQQDKE
jgi:hypothetical protein